MYTLTVDDRELTVSLMLEMLKKLDPEGTHLGCTSPDEALRIALKSPLDVAFLDVEMPGDMNGIELGKKLRQQYPKLDIVIITGFKEYAIDAFGLDASGYLLKPLQLQDVAHQMSVLRFGKESFKDSQVEVRCFGTFEVFCKGKPLTFSYSKSKELLACLIDRNGAVCSNDTMIGCLWPDEPANRQTKARLRKYVKDLKDTFQAAGFPDIIRHQERVGLGLDISGISCDYYRYLQGDPVAIHQYNGRYMTQYAFAEETRAFLSGIAGAEDK